VRKRGEQQPPKRRPEPHPMLRFGLEGPLISQLLRREEAPPTTRVWQQANHERDNHEDASACCALLCTHAAPNPAQGGLLGEGVATDAPLGLAWMMVRVKSRTSMLGRRSASPISAAAASLLFQVTARVAQLISDHSSVVFATRLDCTGKSRPAHT
jgi:hypothetical protein